MSGPRPRPGTGPGGLTGTAWMTHAACARAPHQHLPWTTDTHLLPPSQARRLIAAMTAVCATCPVLRDCARYTDTAGITGGFWAGHDHATGPRRTTRPKPPRRRTQPANTRWTQDALPGLTTTPSHHHDHDHGTGTGTAPAGTASAGTSSGTHDPAGPSTEEAA